LELPVLPLPGGGLAGGAVHEFRAPEGTAANATFSILLLAGLPKATPIIWISLKPTAYPPGLAWLGLDPARCLFAQVQDDAACLGTLEVALRGGMAGVADCTSISRLAARRLALAAKTGGSIGFLLRHAPAFTREDSTAFATRWLIAPAPSAAPGVPRLRAELLYAKSGKPGVFIFEIREVDNGGAPHTLNLVGGRSENIKRRTG
jgi:protein ImuA